MSEEAQIVGASAEEGETAPSARLIREAIDEARDLVRLEVALAREEMGEELGRAKASATAMGAAAAMGIAGLTLLLTAIAFAAHESWLVALLLGAGLVTLAVVAALIGRSAMPTVALPATRERVGSSLRGLRERII
jgi:hypothetical protein